MTIALRRITVSMLLLCTICAAQSLAQTSIGGIVNDYTRVLLAETVNCRSRLLVDSVASFSVGDLVLVMQMQGCTGATGYDVSAVGRCEFATIDTIVGTEFRLEFPLENTYSNCGMIQLVRVPVYRSASVTTPLTGRPWDGRVGGIVVIDVRGTLALRADVRADTLGFRGGAIWQGGGTCSTMVDDDVINSANSAAKGETFVRPLPTMVAGGRALFSGGGGGRGHNSGGGGGGNGGVGGRGGSQWEGCGSFFDNGGRPGDRYPPVLNGKPLPRFGSGGGAGQMNNGNGTGGGRGGGIVIIRCDTLIGNQRVVSANGGSPLRVGLNDGAGGGGAGGTVLIVSPVVTGPVAVLALGGAGGDLNTGGLHGPGGGGGGGCFITSEQLSPNNLTYTLAGGTNGRNQAFTDVRNSVYLAEGGQPGGVGFRAPVPENRTPPPPIEVTAVASYTVCYGDSIVLDCSVIGRADTILWTTTRGKLIGRTKRSGLRGIVSDTFVVKAIGPTGCWALDTVVVTVRDPWNVRLDTLDLGVLRCSAPIDTFITLRNRTTRTAPISRWMVSDSAFIQLLTSTDSVSARDSFQVRLLVSPGDRQGRQVSTITAVVSPCDSAIIAVVSWTRQDRQIDMRPDTVIMPMIETCTTTSEEVTIAVRFTGADVVVEDLLTDSVASASIALPRPLASGDTMMVRVVWSPSRVAATGRLGFVIRDSACLDTFWMTVTGKVKAPFLIAPTTVQADTLTLCEDSVLTVRVPLIADTTTAWIVDSIDVVGPGSASIVRGDSIRGLDTIIVKARPGVSGPYQIALRMRLLPCDTVVTILINGVARDASIRSSPSLTFTERIIGRRQVLVASYVNTGTTPCALRVVQTPRAPFRILRITPVLPMEIGIGDSVTIEVEYRQSFGEFTDSVVLERVAPCPTLLTTLLNGEGKAITRLRIPDVTAKTGQVVDVPVLMVGRPDIDAALLDTFSVRYAWKTSEASVEPGSDARSSWTLLPRGDSTVADIVGRWDGTDTLAVIPMRSLLSLSPSTDLVFDRTPGFLWTGQQSDVQYDDGSLLIDEVCAGRRLRAVGFDEAARPVIQPSPLQDVMQIHLPRTVTGATTIIVSDAVGRAVLQHTISVIPENQSTPLLIDVSSLAAGIYFVHIETTKGSADLPVVVR
ncbi:MAG: T9SS type A sorting domain-containing protein [Candidatus Kapabacteria bacterium]|nr:T9SS type A sorting domain-containing protein [Candidatus Kapabacteria bacterium]